MILLALVGSILGGALVADTALCLPDNPDTRRSVLKFFTSSSFADDRARLGIKVGDTTTLRVLIDSTDRATCRWFRQQVTIPTDRPRDAAYYQARGFYFVSNVPRCTLCTAWGGLAVFDTTFALKGVFAN